MKLNFTAVFKLIESSAWVTGSSGIIMYLIWVFKSAFAVRSGALDLGGKRWLTDILQLWPQYKGSCYILKCSGHEVELVYEMAVFRACFPRCSSITVGKTLQLAGASGAPSLCICGDALLGDRGALGFCS